MIRKKKGLWTFIFSLIPGAGEMYLGFMKRGVSMMLIFFLWCGFCIGTYFETALFLVPVIWFYSFFSVHNLVAMPDEEFYQQEDDYVLLHIDRLVSADRWERGKVKFLAVICIFVGGFSVVNTVWRIFWRILPNWIYDEVYFLRDDVPRVVISLLLIAFGVYLIRGKKQKLDEEQPDVITLPNTKGE